MMNKVCMKRLCSAVLFHLTSLVFFIGQVCAEEKTGEYLKYHEPKPAEVSWLSSLAYVFTLIIVFAIVLGLAYFTSQFFGRRFGKSMATSNAKVLSTLPIGPSSAVYVVEIAGKCLVLGVTANQINLLQEIISQAEIDKLKNEQTVSEGQFESIFRRHLASLQKMSQKFPANVNDHKNQRENEWEKR